MMKSYLFFIFFFIFFYLFSGDRWRLLHKIRLIIKNYFLEKDSPFNIAIFRIVLFFLVLVSLNKEEIIWFSQLPADLQFPPVGMGYFLSVVPITPDLAQQGIFLFVIFSFLAMVGCFARASSLLAALCGIYVLGIPEFYGKVDHYNHLIWFMFILSVSRCADVLSLDAAWKAWRESNQGRVERNQDSVVYALPLRFIWLLMGIIYFFPGFWKFFRAGWDWAFSDNLKYQLYAQWFEWGGWLPFFRLDQHPLLYKASAAATMIFELSFIFLILFPALRFIAIISGLVFHSMTKLLMNISFLDLQICYLAFVNWAGLFAKLGQWAFKEPFQPSYEGRSKYYQRTMAVISKFDILKRLNLPDQGMPLKESLLDQRLIKCVGMSLLLINVFFGLREIMEGWPFACYPTFAGKMVEAKTQTILPFGVKDGVEERINLDGLKQQMRLHRFTGMTRSILSLPDEGQRKAKLRTLVVVMKKEGVDLTQYDKIRFYQAAYVTQPQRAHESPLLIKLLAEIGV